LPQFFRAVEIDGEPYSDGRLTGNSTRTNRDRGSPCMEPGHYAAMQRGIDDAWPVTGEQAATLKRLAQAAYELAK
jgi:hypothetical protein